MRTGRKYLIAVGVSDVAPGLPANIKRPAPILESVPMDLHRIGTLFGEKCGYERVTLPGVPRRRGAPDHLNPDDTQLKAGLRAWLEDTEFSKEDLIVFYFTGHGFYDEVSGQHYLCMAGFTVQSASFALQASDLVKWFFGAHDRPQNFWLIVDACFAAAGTVDAGKAAAGFGGAIPKDQAGLFALAAAHAGQTAAQAAFSRAFVEVVETALIEERYGGRLQKYLRLDALVEELNARFSYDKKAQCAVSSAPAAGGLFRFLSNPRYEPSTHGYTVEQARQLFEREVKTHWARRARGTELERGFYFSGRKEALQNLLEYLRAESPIGHLRIVTGRPGAGKSALLGHLVTLADSEAGKELQSPEGRDFMHGDATRQVGPVDIAIHLRGISLEDLTRRIAAVAAPGFEDPAELMDAIREQEKPLSIVVDALDESIMTSENSAAGAGAYPSSIILRLLLPFSQLPNVRLIVGTRANHLHDFSGRKQLEQRGQLIDLDQDPLEQEAIHAYCRARLEDSVADGGGGLDAESANLIATELSTRQGVSFLLAEIATRGIIKDPLNLKDPDWPAKIPASLEQALEQDFARFDNYGMGYSKEVRDLLTPLAFAQGKGLPRKDIWPNLAQAISGGLPYTEYEIRTLFERAGFYIVEDVDFYEAAGDPDSGVSVYRLFHQELVSYLRRSHDSGHTNRIITNTLLSFVTPDGADHPDWIQVHNRYVLIHLASHASKAGLLDRLVLDVGYLLAANAGRLTLAMRSLRDAAARRVGRVYQRVAHRIGTAPAREAAAYLEMVGLQEGVGEIADGLSALDINRRWTTVWADWQRVATYRVLAPPVSGATSCALGAYHRQPVAVIGKNDGTVDVSSLDERQIVLPVLHRHESMVLAVAVWPVGGHLAVASMSTDGTVMVTTTDGRPLLRGVVDPRGAIRLAALVIDGVCAVLIARKGGTMDGIWAVERRTQDVGERWEQFEQQRHLYIKVLGARLFPREDHDEEVEAIFVPIENLPQFDDTDGGFLRKRAIRIDEKGEEGADRNNQFAVSLINRMLPAYRGGNRVGYSMTTAVLPVVTKAGVLMLYGRNDGTINIWNTTAKEWVGLLRRGHSEEVCSIGVFELSSVPTLLSASCDGQVLAWEMDDVTTGREDVLNDRALLDRSHDEIPEFIPWHEQGVVKMTPNQFGTFDKVSPIRFSAESTSRFLISPNVSVRIAAFELNLISLVSLERYGNRRRRRKDNQQEEYTGWLQGGNEVPEFVVCSHNGRTIVVSSGGSRGPRAWDLQTGETVPVRRPCPGETSYRAFSAVLSTGVVIVACPTEWRSPPERTAVMWDLLAGRLVGSVPCDGGPYAVGSFGGRDIAVIKNQKRTASVYDLSSGGIRGELRHRKAVEGAVLLETDGRAAVLCVEQSAVRAWDANTCEPLTPRMRVEPGLCTAVTAGIWGGLSVMVIGSSSGKVYQFDFAGKKHADPLEVVPRAHVTSVTLGRLGGREVLVAGGGNGRIAVLGNDGRQLLVLETGGSVSQVAIVEEFLVVANSLGVMSLRVAV